MLFVDSPIFTKRAGELLSDEELRGLQNHLARQPLAGDLIKGTGGLRKVRWNLEGSGKRGGCRVIYYFVSAKDEIRMVYIYAKAKQEDLTQEQKKALKQIVQGW